MISQFESGTLMPETAWQEHIDALRRTTASSTPADVKAALLAAVKRRIPAKRFGVFLSGGVDSSLLALLYKQAGADFICYSVGLEGSPDLKAAEEVASVIGVRVRSRAFKLEEMETLFRRTARLYDTVDTLRLGVGAVVAAAADLAKADGITTFIGGLGSEEIFGGYERHADCANVNEECWRGLRDVMWKRDLTRDALLGKNLGIRVLVPFLDDEVIIAAMGIDGKHKVADGEKKVVLREIAQEIGLPHSVAFRKKQAAQYGSWFDKAIEKLARKSGFNTKEEYVRSLTTSA